MRVPSFILVLAVAGAVAAVGQRTTSAAVMFTDVTLGQAGASGFNFVAFQTGPTSFMASNSGTLFNGNVGLASGGSTNFSGGGTIAGALYKDPGATVQSNIGSQMNINGGIITQSLTQAVSDVDTANSDAGMLHPDSTIASIGSSATTLTAIGALNLLGGKNTVYDITGSINITNPSNDLTINGTANDFFIINVAGNVTVSNGGILLSGGITPDHVLFNMTGTGSQVSSVNLSNGTSILNGTYLAPLTGQSINLTPGTVNGAVIGYNIHTSSGPTVNGSPYNPTPISGSGIPEPASLSILGVGIAGLLLRRKR